MKLPREMKQVHDPFLQFKQFAVQTLYWNHIQGDITKHHYRVRRLVLQWIAKNNMTLQ